jgi:hypothetical protein
MPRTKGSKNVAIGIKDEVCMNVRAESCSVCIFDGRTYASSGEPMCKPEEKEAKRLFDIRIEKGMFN